MATKDLHAQPFDETTLAKLKIFEDYTQAWIPTFVMSSASTLSIFDFFAGTGYDKNGLPGSPIRILKILKQYALQIAVNGAKVNLYINEYKKDKFALLEKACREFLETNVEVKKVVRLHLYNLDFDDCFRQLLIEIGRNPSLVFLDQNGVKYLSDKYFLALEKLTQTDFLYFVSSSYLWRFGESDEFKMHIDINIDEAKQAPYYFIHRNLLKQLSEKLPGGSKLKLYPFSLKKGTNVHGIIFGAKHIRAVDKFLDIAWRNNPLNGEANFDIDGDMKKVQLDIFGEKRLTKLEEFELALEETIKRKKVTTNAEVFNFALEKGHPATQANGIVKKLKAARKINYSGISPKINFRSIKNEAAVEIKWL